MQMDKLTTEMILLHRVGYSNTGDYEGKILNFWEDTAKISYATEYLRIYRTDLHQIFRFYIIFYRIGRND